MIGLPNVRWKKNYDDAVFIWYRNVTDRQTDGRTDGQTDRILVEPGLKVDSKYYREVLLKKQMLPVMRRIAGNTFVFRQESALADRACETVYSSFSRKHGILFYFSILFSFMFLHGLLINHLCVCVCVCVSPDLWPHSLDLNPVDYTEFGDWYRNVCTRHRSAIPATWSSASLTQWASSQNVIDEAVGQWRKRLCACMKAKGRDIEHLLN